MKQIRTKQPKQPKQRTYSPRHRSLVGGAGRNAEQPLPHDDMHSIKMLDAYMEGTYVGLPRPEFFGSDEHIKYFVSKWLSNPFHSDDEMMRLFTLLKMVEPNTQSPLAIYWMWKNLLVSFFTHWLGTIKVGTLPWKKQGCDVLQVIRIILNIIINFNFSPEEQTGVMLHEFVVKRGVNSIERFYLEAKRNFVLPDHIFNPGTELGGSTRLTDNVMTYYHDLIGIIATMHHIVCAMLIRARLSVTPQLRVAYEKHLEIARDTHLEYDYHATIVADVDLTKSFEIDKDHLLYQYPF
jgi:hypothetical protein